MNLPWAIVEVMGHRRYGGEIQEMTRFGVPMLRVYVPETTDSYTQHEYPDGRGWLAPTRKREVSRRYPAFVVDLGGPALFAVTECSEAAARAAALHGHRPDGHEAIVTEGEWEPVAPALPGPVEDAEVVDRSGWLCPGCDSETDADGACGTPGCDGGDADGDLVTRQDEGADDLDASELGDA